LVSHSLKRRLSVLGGIGVGLMVALSIMALPAVASQNPFLDKANGHAKLGASGKLAPHPSGGTVVSFDERALMSDNTAAASDNPPDATASALGCANRGSVTNPRVNQDCTLRRQAEEQVAINPMDATNILAGQNDSRIGFNKCGFDYSLNGGTTWGDGLPPFFQHLSLIGHTYDAASDPAVSVDGTGRAWYSCVVFDVNSNASGLLVTRSTPNLKGSAYGNVAAGPGPSQFVVAEDASGANFYDKEFVAADQRPGISNPAAYVTFTDFKANSNCKKSFNKSGFCESPIYISKWKTAAGSTPGWTTPIQISGNSNLCTTGNMFNPQLPANGCNFDQGSYPRVLANGDVYVAFSNYNTPTVIDQQLGVYVHVSGDTMTAHSPVKIGVDNESNLALCDFGRGPEQCVDSLNIRSDDFPALALDRSNANHLVATWTDTRTPSTVSGNYDVVVSESMNGGLTWSDASGGGTVLTTTGAYFEPSVAVAAPSGKVVVSTYNATLPHHTTAIGDGTFGYGYLVKSGTFGAYLSASDSQTNPSPQGNLSQAGFLGDYSSIDSAMAGDRVYMVWSDTRNSNSAGPDEDIFIFQTVVAE
jgi:hypothetical protein